MHTERLALHPRCVRLSGTQCVLHALYKAQALAPAAPTELHYGITRESIDRYAHTRVGLKDELDCIVSSERGCRAAFAVRQVRVGSMQKQESRLCRVKKQLCEAATSQPCLIKTASADQGKPHSSYGIIYNARIAPLFA